MSRTINRDAPNVAHGVPAGFTPIQPPRARSRTSFLGAPHFHNINQACRAIAEAYGHHVYLVGSCLERADYRDVDVRCILDDEDFARLFPGTEGEANAFFGHGARLSLLNAAISLHLSRTTGLPVDFQFQQQSLANRKYDGMRVAIGIYIERKPEGEAP